MAEAHKIGPALVAERRARLDRWREYVEDLTQEVWMLHHHRGIWREMRDALQKASGDQPYFLEHYWDLYSDRQMIAVRRLVDSDHDVISMTRLLRELSENPETMTRSEHLKMWGITGEGDVDAWDLKDANAAFDRYADGDGDNVDPSTVRSDLHDWKAKSGKIKKFVDKHIAHSAETARVPRVSEKELDQAIDNVASLIQKYTTLFTASFIAKMEPVISGDWKLPFRQALFSPLGSPESRALVALHEAAHAVVAVRLDVWVERARLAGDDNGNVETDKDVIFSDPLQESDRTRIRNEIAIGLAGPIVDERTHAPRLERRTQQHLDVARQFASQFLPADEIEGMIDELWPEVRALVEECWPQIVVVATALENAAAKELSGAELRRMLGVGDKWEHL